VLGGDIPSPIDPPSGCRFLARCPSGDAELAFSLIEDYCTAFRVHDKCGRGHILLIDPVSNYGQLVRPIAAAD
jgi:hypothetical protein